MLDQPCRLCSEARLLPSSDEEPPIPLSVAAVAAVDPAPVEEAVEAAFEAAEADKRISLLRFSG